MLSALTAKALAQMFATSVERLRECSNLLTREVKDQLEATDPVPDSQTSSDIWVQHPLQKKERKKLIHQPPEEPKPPESSRLLQPLLSRNPTNWRNPLISNWDGCHHQEEMLPHDLPQLFFFKISAYWSVHPTKTYHIFPESFSVNDNMRQSDIFLSRLMIACSVIVFFIIVQSWQISYKCQVEDGTAVFMIHIWLMAHFDWQAIRFWYTV